MSAHAHIYTHLHTADVHAVVVALYLLREVTARHSSADMYLQELPLIYIHHYLGVQMRARVCA